MGEGEAPSYAHNSGTRILPNRGPTLLWFPRVLSNQPGNKRELHMDCSLCDNLEIVPSLLLTCHCLEHSHGDTYLQESLENVVYLGAQEDDNTGVGEN